MRLLLVLLAVAISAWPMEVKAAVNDAAPTTPSSATAGNLCTAQQSTAFTKALKVASSGCTANVAYNWTDTVNPTPAQLSTICICTTVSDFPIPDCNVSKTRPTDQAISDPSTLAAHYHWVMQNQCVDEFPCTAQMAKDMSKALHTETNGCTADASYNWSSPTNPTATEIAQICKCTPIGNFTIPQCSVTKKKDNLPLSDTSPLNKHYGWLIQQCHQASLPPTRKVEETKSKVGLIAGIAGGVVVVALIVAFIIWKRKRKRRQEQNWTNADLNDMRLPVGYQQIVSTPPVSKPNGNSRPSGRSNAAHSTNSTTDGSMRPSSTISMGTHGTNGSTHSSEAGKWDDPVIMAVRIPHDSIFIGSLLSRGGFGEVYRGTYKGEIVAIKNLLPERRKNLALIDDFLGEAKLMSSLEHERIVKFVGVAWSSLSDVCLVVEFMENGDLRSLLSRWDSGSEKRMSGFDEDKVRIALHVSHALVYLHSLQPVVVHRDLKSKNILLDANYDAKLTDFGISRERADATMTAGVGSALWMAPEVMMGSRYDEKADIFSFGVVLSELDTHQLPYFHARVTESGQKMPEAAILQQVMLGRLSVDFTDRADPDLVQLGHECVNLDPTARPTTAQVLHRVHQAMKKYHYNE